MQLTLEKSYIAGKPVRVDDLGGQLFGGEANAHKFVITQYAAQSSAETIAITGSVSGTLMASTGATVPLTGSLEDGKAVVVLDEDCYKVPGRFVLTIFVTSGDATLCIYDGVGNILRTSTDTVVYPTESLPNLTQLVNQVQAAIDSFPADLTAIQAAIAANYDDLTYPIAAGTYAWHAGTLYKAKADIATTEAWTAAHWETVHAANDLATDISSLKGAIGDIATVTSLLSGKGFIKGQINTSGVAGTSNIRSYCPTFIPVNTEKPLHIECDLGYLYKLSFYTANAESAFVEETTYNTGFSVVETQYPYFRITYSYNPASISPPNTDNITVISILQYDNSAADDIDAMQTEISGLHADIENVSDRVVTIEDATGIYAKNYIEGLTFANGRINRLTGAIATSNAYSFSSTFIQVDTQKPLYCECDSGYLGYLAPYNIDQDAGFTDTVIDFTAATPIKIDDPEAFYRITYAKDPVSDAPSPTTDNRIVRLYQYAVKSDESQTRYTVAKSGGDFSKLIDALNFAKTHKDITIYVAPGDWDIVDELGTDFFSSYTSESPKGCFLGNGMHLLFSPKANVVCNYTGDNAYVKSLFSPFNPGFGDFVVEGMNLSATNVRYCVHDDRSGDTANTYHKYKNCSMILDNRNNASWDATQCIGGGLALSSNIEIVGCVFESLLTKTNTDLVSWHNSATANAKSTVVIKDCYFKGSGSIRISWYGESTLMSRALISGNSLGAPVRFVPQTGSTVENVELYAWNNEIRAT